MDFIDSEQLIFAVKKCPCLYDVTDEKYKDRNLKQKSWEKIARSLAGENWDEISKDEIEKEIQKRWKSLRDAFIRDWRLEQRIPNDSKGKKKRQYIYFNQMSFLIPALETRLTSGNIEEVQLIPSNQFAKRSSNRQPEKEVEESRVLRKKKKCRDNSEVSKPEYETRESKEVDDHDKMFLLSLLPSYRKLEPNNKMDVQIEIIQSIKRRLESQASTDNYY